MKARLLTLFSAFCAISSGQITIGTNATAIGASSIAIGVNAESGEHGISVGSVANASYSSIAIGGSAEGGHSIAIGRLAQSLDSSAISLGAGIAQGFGSFAVGYYNEDNNQQGTAQTESMSFHGRALGFRSISLGVYSFATNDLSVAIGYFSMSSGHNAVAIGGESDAIGDHSTALGAYTLAAAPRSAAVGAWNKPVKKGTTAAPDPIIATPTDPIFNVGNGEGFLRRNALTVYRDGDAHFAGTVRIKPSGDIGMGSFTEGMSYQP